MAYANAYKRGREEGRAATGVSGECRSEHEQGAGDPLRALARETREIECGIRQNPLYPAIYFPYIECFCSKRIILAGSRIRKRILRAPRRPPSDASGLTLNLQRGKRPAGPVHGPVCWGPAFLSHATPIAHRPHPRAAAHSPAAHAGRDGGSTLLGRNRSREMTRSKARPMPLLAATSRPMSTFSASERPSTRVSARGPGKSKRNSNWSGKAAACRKPCPMRVRIDLGLMF